MTVLTYSIDVLEYSGIAWPNARLFESCGPTSRRPPQLSTRVPSVTGHEAHAHSPQRSAINREDVWTRIATRADQSHKEYPFRTGVAASSRFGSQVLPTTSNALSGTNDPFIAPAPESSLGWRSATRKFSTDESMPDYVSHGTDSSRADTDMSINWPRRDFQRHMDEAAVEEIIEALSPTKKGQLLNALSPSNMSSSGVQAPVNTPTTDLLNQDASEEVTPRHVLSGPNAGNSGSISTGARASWMPDTAGKVAGLRSMMTRSMRPSGGITPDDLNLLAHRRARSSSGSSKRKRSVSRRPQDAKRELKLDLTPPARAQTTRRTPLKNHETSSDSDTATSTDENEGSESNTARMGVSLGI